MAIELIVPYGIQLVGNLDRVNALQMLRNFLLKTVTWTVAVNRHGRVGDSRVVCHWKDKFPASGVYNVKSNDTMMRKIKINNYFEKQCLQCQVLLQPPHSLPQVVACVSVMIKMKIYFENVTKVHPPNYLTHFVNNKNSENDNNFWETLFTF